MMVRYIYDPSFIGAGFQNVGGTINVDGDVIIGTPNDNGCLAHLLLTDPRDDKTRIESHKGGLLRESYNWILSHNAFLQWRDSCQSNLLWIKGDPGKGKTMLLCGIIDEITKQCVNTTDTLSFFFCQATNNDLNNARAVLRGLIYLLVDNNPFLLSHVMGRYMHGGRTLFEGINAWVALSDIFTNILLDPCLPNTTLIIDALDECETDLQQLLDLIMRIPPRFNVKWLLSSRNKVDIEQKLLPNQSQTRLSLELKSNADHVSHAVAVFIDHCILEIPGVQSDAGLRTHVRDQMRQKANGTYLWVSLVAQELKKAQRWEIKNVIDAIPAGLEELYKRMMKQIHSLNPPTSTYCRKVLAAVITAYRPLYLEELAALSGLPKDLTIREVELVAKSCGSFLTIREGRVFIIHQSAQDFLVNRANKSIFTYPYSLKSIHRYIYRRSLQIMDQVLRRNLYNLNDFEIPDSKGRLEPPNPDPLASIRYSCIHWIDHFVRSEPEGRWQHGCIEDLRIVETFLQRHYLHWLEALGILREVAKGISAMIQLNKLMPTPFAKDATRFIIYNQHTIDTYPLQVYGSALIFSPSESIVRCHFKGDEPQWLSLKANVEHEWDACLIRIPNEYSGEVTSMTFSLDGKHLAFMSDDDVFVVDAMTGMFESEPEESMDIIKSLAFPPDWIQSLPCPHDNTIEECDTATGTCVTTAKSQDNGASLKASSPDGSRLVSYSGDKIIVKSTKGAPHMVKLLGHDEEVTSVAFSPNGKQLASSSLDETIKLWDINTGTCIRTMELKWCKVTSMAFSPDGRQLASAWVGPWMQYSFDCLGNPFVDIETSIHKKGRF